MVNVNPSDFRIDLKYLHSRSCFPALSGGYTNYSADTLDLKKHHVMWGNCFTHIIKRTIEPFSKHLIVSSLSKRDCLRFWFSIFSWLRLWFVFSNCYKYFKNPTILWVDFLTKSRKYYKKEFYERVWDQTWMNFM